MAIKSEPKKQLIHFIKNSVLEEDYKFTIEGDESDAKSFVQRMRVELSRLRDIARNRKLTIARWKMLQKGIEVNMPSHDEVDETNIFPVATITLLRSQSGHVEIPDDVNDALSFMSEE